MIWFKWYTPVWFDVSIWFNFIWSSALWQFYLSEITASTVLPMQYSKPGSFKATFYEHQSATINTRNNNNNAELKRFVRAMPYELVLRFVWFSARFAFDFACEISEDVYEADTRTTNPNKPQTMSHDQSPGPSPSQPLNHLWVTPVHNHTRIFK